MNTKLAVIVLAVVAVAGCTKDPVGTDPTNNPNFAVDRLFTVDGCMVYRFFDGGRAHYFTRCPDSSTTTEGWHSEGCGKGCVSHIPEEIETRRGKP